MQQLWLIPLFPLIGFLINGLFGRKLPKSAISLVAVGTVVASFLWVLKTLSAIMPLETPHIETYATWIQSGFVNIPFEFAVDRLTAVMLLVVTGIGSLIHVYATGYMAEEDGYYRFFAYLNLFMFFMLTLVLGNNYLLLFVGWEGVGLCSYLLIGFYYLKNSASTAGNKAFIVNRVGDFGFSLAMFLIVIQFKTLTFQDVMKQAAQVPVEHAVGMMTVICLLLLVGAAGKSAQVPLHVWLPDAMEGPTPVSALIHAATMVTAGVYMTCRSATIFLKAPIAMEAVAIVGLITAVLAATIGMTQWDIKKVFAYSTISQLGYMFLAAGVGAFGPAMWHVVTHAFFKALLFLGAGAVIYSMHHEQDMRHMGGLRKYIPITFGTLACAWIAIAGVPLTSGWFSKEAILGAVYHHSPIMYWIAVLTAMVTAFYVSRSMFLTFFGEFRGAAVPAAGHHGHGDEDDHGHDDHGHAVEKHDDRAHAVAHNAAHDTEPHEAPFVMWGPLAVLAALSIVGGFFDLPHFLEPALPPAEHVAHEAWLEIVGSAAGILGIVIAHIMYVAKPEMPDALTAKLGGLYRLVYDKYRVDEAYDLTIVDPLIGGSRSFLWKGLDAGLIDGMVNGAGSTARLVGGFARWIQTGNMRTYGAWVLVGAVAVLAYLGIGGGVR
ncbi:MAG: NADH-quinone oxidoreductase subunit L [Acidobacteria bacterium]|nr:NADH-quinone oxidoreductase subunit L [Acidobacteriota bacterium]